MKISRYEIIRAQTLPHLVVEVNQLIQRDSDWTPHGIPFPFIETRDDGMISGFAQVIVQELAVWGGK
jgi:hypothetical protein